MKVERRSLAGQAATMLLARIVAGEWPVGAKLPGETSLAAELGVGRSTVREALRDLAARRVVETRQGAGVFVVATAPAEDWQDLLRRAAIADVVEGRLAVETEAARRAARRRTAEDLALLEATLAARGDAEAQADDTAFVDADLEFHQAVVTAAHNDVLDEMFRSFRPRVRSAMIDMLALLGPAERRPPEVHAAHRGIADAVRTGDAELAAARSRAHLEELHARL